MDRIFESNVQTILPLIIKKVLGAVTSLVMALQKCSNYTIIEEASPDL